MKKFGTFLFSMLLTGVLLVIFAISIGYATFLENDYGTVTAKILIYNARWFESLLLLLCINLIGSIFVNKLYSRRKWPILLFHVAFILILIGAAITRYYGYEGIMHIREGESSDYIISEETYIRMVINDGQETVEENKKVLFSPYTANKFSENITVNDKTVQVNLRQFIPSATETIVPDPEGVPVLSLLIIVDNMQRLMLNLREGEIKNVEGQTISFNSGENADLNIFLDNNSFFILSPDSVFISEMGGKTSGVIVPGNKSEINTQTLYSAGRLRFAVNHFYQKGKIQIRYSTDQEGQRLDALIFEISAEGEANELVTYGKKGMEGEMYDDSVGGADISVSYGSQKIKLPYSIHLTDFQLERYPGSNSPSSFASEVVLKDGSFEKPYRIYMNNILKYSGFRFFQSSYDTDEKGTVLSVNKDVWGTSITYFGYFLMMFGFIFTLFIKDSRFSRLIKASAKLREDRKKLLAIIVFVLMASGMNAGNTSDIKLLKSNHITEFEELLIQSTKGRIEPTATMASEILRKVAKKNRWNGMPASEVFLHMQANPAQWQSEPIILVSNKELREKLGISGEYAAFNDLVLPANRGGYKLNNLASLAFAKKSNERTKFDKEIINVDERVNIVYNVLSANYLTVFPVPGHPDNKWVATHESAMMGGESENFAKQAIPEYLAAVAGNDWASASQLLNKIKSFQNQNGGQIIPSDTKIKLEIFYHKADVFGKLSKIFLTIGLILLLIQISTILNPKIKFEKLKKAAFLIIAFLFLIQTAGLAVRWYISGHAPWSNGYESMVFVSWATLLTGLLLASRSEITLSLTTMLAGITLLVAGFSWMNPEITNLVPVLKSYWLIVHVAVIMASYGFLGIAAMLGLLNLVLMILKNRKNEVRINHTIKELVIIIHISIIVGLFLLASGSFLGGVWANESWGRYWGWDPKETWAMVTILVYSFIVHMHKIPGFRGNYAVSAAALTGFGSVLMTYFGVNYYLSGLHSYAQGEPPAIPAAIYAAAAIIIILVLSAFILDKQGKNDEVVIP